MGHRVTLALQAWSHAQACEVAPQVPRPPYCTNSGQCQHSRRTLSAGHAPARRRGRAARGADVAENRARHPGGAVATSAQATKREGGDRGQKRRHHS